MRKAKSKLKFKPTPISRLLRYRRTPPKMVGDPHWKDGDWSDRCAKVYEYMIDQRYPRVWSDDLWIAAWRDNHTLDYWCRVKWDQYDDAWSDHIAFIHEEAERDNAAWDYHHDNYIAA